MMTEAATVQLALEAARAATLAQYAKEGYADYGSCGGAMLGYRANTKFGKALLAVQGLAHKSEGTVWVIDQAEPEVRTQSANVWQAGKRAFRDTAREAGYEPSRYWTYID
jgi:hypothetical protein